MNFKVGCEATAPQREMRRLRNDLDCEEPWTYLAISGALIITSPANCWTTETRPV
jgi:hypothetical protein